MRWMTSPRTAALTVAGLALGLGLLLTLGAATAPAVLLGAVALAQALVLAAWHRALAVPGALGGAVVGGAVALGCDVLVLIADGDRPLEALPPVLALSVLGALLHQLLRRDEREDLSASLAATLSLAAVAAMGMFYLAADGTRLGGPLVAGTAAAAAIAACLVGAARLVRSGTKLPEWAVLTALTVGVVAVPVSGVVVAALTELGIATAVAVSLVSAALAAVGATLAARATVPQPLLAGALPMLVAAPTAYILGRLLVG